MSRIASRFPHSGEPNVFNSSGRAEPPARPAFDQGRDDLRRPICSCINCSARFGSASHIQDCKMLSYP